MVWKALLQGLTLGVTRGTEFKPLIAALAFHQFFEGMALSTVILDAKFAKTHTTYLLSLLYTLTTPSGIAIGIIANNSTAFADNNTDNLIVQGVLDSISAGILIYDALINILAPHLDAREFRSAASTPQALQFGCLWIGAAIMAVIGRWA